MSNNNKLATKQHNNNQFKDIPFEKRPKITIYPRSKENIFKKDSNELKDLLPDFQQNLFFVYKTFELRFYIDIAIKQNGIFMGHRKLTAIVHGPDDKPLPKKAILWSLKSGSKKLRFLDTSNNLKKKLSNNNAPKTDDKGMVEVTIVHPAENINAGEEKLVISAELDGSESEIRLTIKRNSDVIDLDQISRKNEKNAEHIWIYQPIQNQRSPENIGIKKIQEICNEVISRHKGIPSNGVNKYKWVPLDGVYGEETKKAIKQYLNIFKNVPNKNVPKGRDYPYDLSKIGLSENLINYLKSEYSFDPESDDNKGKIIDRHLLIGNTWDITPKQIDGLLELYEGVTQILKDQMRKYGQTYLDCSTFWLHRPMPIHGPYQQANDSVFGCHHNKERLRTAPNNTAPFLTFGRNPVEINDGDHFLVLNRSGGWVQINHPLCIGWIEETRGKVILNDAGRFRNVGKQNVNSGNHGVAGVDNQPHTLNGVAYTYGGKQTPTEWLNDMTTNPHANPNQICHYSEYQPGYRFGETKAEYDKKNFTYKEAGCDCSGFIQNCMVHACFPGTDTRIIPESFFSAKPWRGNAGFLNRVVIKDPITKKVKEILEPVLRPISRPLNDLQRHWVRGADIIQQSGHIVMTSEDVPNMLNNNVDFLIMQESGSDDKRDKTQFRRKSVRSRFNWWKKTTKGFNFGKPYIWG